MKKLLALFILLSMLLCGCNTIMASEYISVEPHNEQYVEDEDSDVLTVENYAGLKNAILSLVETGLEYGVIKVNNYDGEITEDVASAAYEVARNDPLGAFAIDYLTHDYSRIVSYYELHIYITYRRTVEDIQSIVRVSGENELRDNLKTLLSDFGTRAIYRFSYYSDMDYGLIIDQLCQDNPLLEFGDPTVTASLYPESGVQRIVELNIDYSVDVDALRLMKQALETEAQEAVDSIQPTAPNEMKAYRLYRRLVNNTAFDWQGYERINDGSDDAFGFNGTAYGALVEKLALPEGFAKAYYLMCGLAGIDCQIVHGRRAGYDYVWNIIKLDGQYYHVDCASAVSSGFQGFLLTDADMTDYRWSADQYPACEGELTIADVVPSLAATPTTTALSPTP